MTAASSGDWLELADGRRLQVDERGYLVHPEDWDEALASELARRDGLELGPEHWQVIHLLRSYHARHGRSPAMRLLVREVAQALGTGVANSRVLYRLFPQGPAKQAARYAGLPRPASCI